MRKGIAIRVGMLVLVVLATVFTAQHASTETFGAPGDANNPFWTWLNQNSATATWTGGTLNLTAPSRGGSSNMNCLESQTLPAAPYKFVTLFYNNFSGTGSHQNTAHFGFYETSTAKLETIAFQNTFSGNFRYYLSENSNFTTDAQTTLAENGPVIPNPLSVQIENDGTNLNFYTSADGISYTKQFTTTKTAFFTTGPTNVILCIDNISSGTGNYSIDYDYFRKVP